MDLSEIVEPLNEFYLDSKRLLMKCSKPDAKEFQKIAFATFIGFCVMGGIGFAIKLVHIPINNIIVYVGHFFPASFLSLRFRRA